MQKKKLSQSGITLIALIITIIVMLILVAVTVKVAIDSGLFGHAKKAVDDWKAAEEQESNIGNGPVTIGGVTYNSLDEYLATLPNTPETPDTPTTPDRTGLSVGDYVAYTPDTVSNYTGLGSSETEKAGSTSNPADGIPQDTTLTWRILSINDDGSVDLVSTKPTSTEVYFKNSIGFNNGVYLLNDLCASLYSNTELGVTARSMNLMDIESKLNATGIAARDAYTYDGTQYGNTKTYTSAQIPDIFDHVGTSLAERNKPYYNTPTTLTHTQKDSIDIEQTYYNFGSTTPTEYFDDSTFYELVFGTGTYYWLASRYADCNASRACFGLRFVNSAALRGNDLFYSNGAANSHYYFVRPVVSLGSDIQISRDGGTADSPRTLSK